MFACWRHAGVLNMTGSQCHGCWRRINRFPHVWCLSCWWLCLLLFGSSIVALNAGDVLATVGMDKPIGHAWILHAFPRAAGLLLWYSKTIWDVLLVLYHFVELHKTALPFRILDCSMYQSVTKWDKIRTCVLCWQICRPWAAVGSDQLGHHGHTTWTTHQ